MKLDLRNYAMFNDNIQGHMFITNLWGDRFRNYNNPLHELFILSEQILYKSNAALLMIKRSFKFLTNKIINFCIMLLFTPP